MRSSLLLAILVFSASSLAADDTLVKRTYPMANLGQLILNVPASWTEALQVPKGGLPPTIALSDPSGKMELLITPIPTPKGEPAAGSNVRVFVQFAAARILPTAMQKELPLQPIRAKDGGGFYFWATDRAPKAGEYEHMAEGAVPAGPLILNFTVLTHEMPPASLRLPLQIMGSAQHER